MQSPITKTGATQADKQGFPRGRATLPLTALALAVGVTTNLYAQDSKPAVTALEEIIVTAQRREEGLQSIPVSIAAVTAEDLDAKGITGFQQLSETVSGISLSRPSSAVSSGVYVRGVGTAGTSPAAQSVGVMIDGVYQKRSGTAFNELMDVQRVEVLRGPQGTLFGKNTTAGMINVVTADPDTSDFAGKVQGVLGNLSNEEVRGMLNIPLVADKLALRVTGFNAERDGYTKRSVRATGESEDTRNVDRHGYRAKLLWEATDDVQVKLSAENIKNDMDMDQANVTNGVKIGHYLQHDGYVSEDVERYVLNLNWAIWNHTLSTISSYDDSTTFLLNDFDESDLVNTILTNEGDTKTTTHEVQWSSDFDGPFSYILGYFFQNEELESATIINGTPRPLTVRDIDSDAWFGNLSYAIADDWTVSLGARYTEDEYEGTSVFFPQGDVTVFDEWTYTGKVTYQLNPDTMLYASYGTGFKSGGINNITSVLAADQLYWQPETTDAIELGLKSEFFDNRVRINTALFFQTYDDFQVTQNIPGEARTIVTNAAEVESKGIETELTAALTDILTVNGSLTWVQSEYKNNEHQACTVVAGTGYPGTPDGRYPGCVQTANGGWERDISGEQLDHAPELSFNLGAELRSGFGLLNGTDWFARADVVYRSEQNLEVWQPSETEEGSYYLVNARAGLESEAGWKVTAWVNNLLDEDYVAEAYWTGTNPVLRKAELHQIPGLERTYGVTVDYAF